jgi:magnesium transporter
LLGVVTHPAEFPSTASLPIPNESAAVHESAETHLVRHLPTARKSDLVGDALRHLRAEAFEEESALYVLDSRGGLEGIVSIADLVRELPAIRVGELVRTRPQCVGSSDDQERVAFHALRSGLSAVPVADEAGRFLGVVPARTLLLILHREHIEDLHRLAGITRETSLATSALDTPPVRRFRHRLPWLLVGLAGSALSAALMVRFEHALERRIAVAFFVPGIVYLADAIGTQTEAIVVRGLSLSHTPLRRVLFGEVRTGALLGLAFGAVTLPAVYFSFGDLRLALAVSLAVLAAGSVATAIGVLLPWTLSRHGHDPAFGSGPVATIIQDMLSLVIYFGCVSFLLSER